MSEELGTIAYGSEHSQDEVFLGRDFNNTKNYSEETAAKIDSEIKRIVTEAYELAEKLLRDNLEKLHFVAAYLEKNETMDDEQFRAVMDGDPTFDELEAMVADRKRQSEEENRLRAEHIKRKEAEREAERLREEKKKSEGNGGNLQNPQGPDNFDNNR